LVTLQFLCLSFHSLCCYFLLHRGTQILLSRNVLRQSTLNHEYARVCLQLAPAESAVIQALYVLCIFITCVCMCARASLVGGESEWAHSWYIQKGNSLLVLPFNIPRSESRNSKRRMKHRRNQNYFLNPLARADIAIVDCSWSTSLIAPRTKNRKQQFKSESLLTPWLIRSASRACLRGAYVVKVRWWECELPRSLKSRRALHII
jgi:hypothetical protein